MTPEIKKKLKAIQAGKVPAGYRKTAVGIVPKEWEDIFLGEIFTDRNECNCLSMNLLSITADKGIVPRSEIKGKDNSSEDKSKYKRVYTGDIAYNTMRMWQGVSAISAFDGIVSPAYTVLNPSKNICAPFFSYLFRTKNLINLFYRNSQGLVDDTRSLKYEWFKKILVSIPPLPEQRKIAEILTAQDRVITLKEKLVAEKRKQKKFLMQRLLSTDDTRPFKLNGVMIDKCKWEKKSLRDCCTADGQYGLNAPACEYKKDLPKYLRITDITESGKYDTNSNAYVNTTDYHKYLLKENDILFVRTGSTTGKSYLYNINDGILIFAGFLIRFSINPKIIDPKIILAIINTEAYWKWVKIMSMRSGQPGINSIEYANYEFKIPPTLPEQQAIAEVLSAADREISLLQQNLEQERQKKKSLMQLLLSGLVRVNAPEDFHEL